jgi:hypothetical protein
MQQSKKQQMQSERSLASKANCGAFSTVLTFPSAASHMTCNTQEQYPWPNITVKRTATSP